MPDSHSPRDRRLDAEMPGPPGAVTFSSAMAPGGSQLPKEHFGCFLSCDPEHTERTFLFSPAQGVWERVGRENGKGRGPVCSTSVSCPQAHQKSHAWPQRVALCQVFKSVTWFAFFFSLNSEDLSEDVTVEAPPCSPISVTISSSCPWGCGSQQRGQAAPRPPPGEEETA